MKKISKRRYTQLIAAVLYNCNIRGFAGGTIYKGAAKGLCAPGLNCYSCPGATLACPLGSLQSGLLSSRYRFSYYVLGTILLMGILFGRLICGFLCPFGLVQDLMYKIPIRKVLRRIPGDRYLRYIKYAVLL